jgi:hypothetical protein
MAYFLLNCIVIENNTLPFAANDACLHLFELVHVYKLLISNIQSQSSSKGNAYG